MSEGSEKRPQTNMFWSVSTKKVNKCKKLFKAPATISYSYKMCSDVPGISLILRCDFNIMKMALLFYELHYVGYEIINNLFAIYFRDDLVSLDPPERLETLE